MLQGNHEAMLTGRLGLDADRDRVYRLAAQRERLGGEEMDFLDGLSPRLEMAEDGVDILFVHGTPQDPLEGTLYPDGAWAGAGGFDVVFMGHTHWQCEFSAPGCRGVNVGSCGLPRDIGTLPGFCLFDTRTREVELLRTEVAAAEVAGAYPGVHPDVLARLERAADGAATWSVI